ALAAKTRATGLRPALDVIAAPFVLMLAMACLVAVVPPAGEFPINDDWDFARIVQTLVERGTLEFSAWTAASVVAQIYWGAVFVKLFGFSHTVLRVSTLILAAFGTLGFYVLLRQSLDRLSSLLGALLLLFNPLYVYLSYSFLTDVPFLALSIWALVCYGRALRAGAPRLRWLVAGSTIAAAAYLIRQTGVALPVAVLVALLLTRGRPQAFRLANFLAIVGPLLPAVALSAYVE